MKLSFCFKRKKGGYPHTECLPKRWPPFFTQKTAEHNVTDSDLHSMGFWIRIHTRKTDPYPENGSTYLKNLNYLNFRQKKKLDTEPYSDMRLNPDPYMMNSYGVNDEGGWVVVVFPFLGKPAASRQSPCDSGKGGS